MITQAQRIILCTLSLALLGFTLTAQSSVDTTFNAIPSGPLPTNTTFQQIVQPDGKIIVYRAPSMYVNGELRSGMFRLNADGSTDSSFSYNNEAGVGINNIMLAPDGKIVLGGTSSPNHSKLARLNSDGSVDQSFSVFIAASGPPEIVSTSFSLDAVQPDGKVIATRRNCGNIMGTWCSFSLHRYNVDGSSDTSFVPPPLDGGHLVSTFAVVELLPDGRFYLAITSRSHLGGSLNISRRLANGSADSSYAPFSATFGSSSFLSIDDLSVASDGGLLATGVFSPAAIGFPPQQQVRRYLPNGSNATFAAPAVFTGTGIHQLPDGKVFYSATGGLAARPLMRLNNDGSIDNTFTLDPVITSISNSWDVDPMDRPVFLAATAAGPRLVRILDNGSIDPAFSPALGSSSSVHTFAVQTDGRILVSGPFATMNGVVRSRVARINADGSTDQTFNLAPGFTGAASGLGQLLLQPDGKILAPGGGLAYNGVSVDVVRINPDGTRDDTFVASAVPAGSISRVALQPDGKVLVGGRFSSINGVTRSCIARLNSNGEVDPTFDAVVSGGSTGPSVTRILVEPSGKIIIAGFFTTVNGVSRNRLARLESNGALDPTFDPSSGSIGLVAALMQQPDGKYLIAEDTRTLQRRNGDGTVDSGFTPPSFAYGGSVGWVNTVLLQPDGSMLVAGQFDLVGGILRRNLTRLRANGAHDPSFMPNGTNDQVVSLVSYPGARALVGGFFTSIDNVLRSGIARINIPAIRTTTPFDFDGDGRSDISVFRPSTNRWYEALSSGPTTEETFGIPGDVLAPADFDGDGKTDEAVYRPANGHWWYKSSLHGGQVLNPFGGPGDIPRPSDFDGDGKADFVIFRPSNSTWYRVGSLTPQQEALPKVFGQAGDQPLVGDFDGDGRSDLAVFRPSNGDWWYAASSAGGAFRNVHWGQNGDIPVPADYDGDGRSDLAVYRHASPQSIFYVLGSTAGFSAFGFGVSTDTVVTY